MNKKTFFIKALGIIILVFLFGFHTGKKNNYDQDDFHRLNQGVPDEEHRYEKAGVGNILLPSDEADRYIDMYQKKIRTPLIIINDKLSKAIWFDTAALKLLDDYIRDPQYKIDGVRMHMIAYETNNTADGQYMKHQISVVMVPTVRGDTIFAQDGTIIQIKHEDDWNILKRETQKMQEYFSRKSGGRGPKPIGGFGVNHGELCPEDCP